MFKPSYVYIVLPTVCSVGVSEGGADGTGEGGVPGVHIVGVPAATDAIRQVPAGVQRRKPKGERRGTITFN